MKNKIFILLIVFLLVLTPVFAKDFVIRNESDSDDNYFVVNGSTGYVGIGLGDPSNRFQVASLNAATDIISATDSSGNLLFRVRENSGGYGEIYLYNSSHEISNLISSQGDSYFNGGNVGIGTTSPTSKLHIFDENDARLTIEAQVNENSSIDLFESDNDGGRIYYDGTNNVLNIFGVVNDVEYGGISVLRDSGNVGIGTTSPLTKLHLNSGATSGYLARFQDSGSRGIDFYSTGSQPGIVSSSGEGLYIGTNGDVDNSIFIDSTGNVGIGTTSPSNILHTSSTGGIRIQTSGGSGDITVGGYAAAGLYSDSAVVGIRGANGGGAFLAPYNGAYGDGVYVKNNGNVGIGTTSPGAKLEIGSGQVLVPNGNKTNPSYSFSTTGNYGFFKQYSNTIGVAMNGITGYRYNDNYFEIASDKAISWNSANDLAGSSPDLGLSRGSAGKVYVGNGTVGDSSGTLIAGNVGIGTTSPTARLHIKATGTSYGNGGIRLTQSADSTYWDIISAYSALYFGHGGSTRYWIDDNGMSFGSTGDIKTYITRTTGNSYFNGGNVGIGTTSPLQKLHVNGNILANGTINATTDVCIEGGNCLSTISASGLGAVTGSGTLNYIPMWNGTTSLNNSVIYQSGGNVGINNTSPTKTLEVNGTFKASSQGSSIQLNGEGNLRIGI